MADPGRAIATLIRIVRAEAEAVQARLAALRERDAQLAAQDQTLAQTLAREAGQAPIGNFAAYAARLRGLRGQIASERTALGKAEAALREELERAFIEMKGLEESQRLAQARADAEQARRETATLDEIASLRRRG